MEVMLLIIGLCLLVVDAIYTNKALRAYKAKQKDKLAQTWKVSLILSILISVSFFCAFFLGELKKPSVTLPLALAKAVYDVLAFVIAFTVLLFYLRKGLKRQGNGSSEQEDDSSL